MQKSNNILSQKRWLMPQDQIEILVDSYKSFVKEGKDKAYTEQQLEEARANNIPITLVSESGIEQKNAANVQLIGGSSNVQNGKVAILELRGTFFTYFDWFVYEFGGIAMDLVTYILNALEQEPSIEGVVLDIDSNGGALNGTEALAKLVSRYKKPIGAYVRNNCHSAAYWFVSGSDFILTESETTYLGSIGVMMTHVNREKMYEDYGLDVTYISAPQSTKKIKAPDNKAISDSDLETLLAMLRQDCQVFINAVKKGRGDKIDIEAVSNGDIFNSRNASRLGLHDGLASNGISDAIKRISKLKNQNGKSAESKSSMEGLKNLNVSASPLKVKLMGNTKQVIVKRSDLKDLDEKFADLDLKDVAKKAVDGIQLEFSALGLNARKATLSNILASNKDEYCMVNCEELAGLNAMVEESLDDTPEQPTDETTTETPVDTPQAEEPETPSEEAEQPEDTPEDVSDESEDTPDQPEDKPEQPTDEAPTTETANEQAEAANSEGDKFASLMEQMNQMASAIQDMNSKMATMQETNKTLSSELETANAQKEEAESKAAKIVEKAKKVESKFKKVILSTDPSESKSIDDDGKVTYNLGKTEKEKSINAIRIAKSIHSNRQINKNGKIYQKGNEMKIGG